MGINGTIPVLYAQTHLASSLVTNAAMNPQTAVAVSRVLASEMVKQEQKQIEKSNNSNETQVSDGKGKGTFLAGQRRNRKNADEDALFASDNSLFDSDILNTKI